MVYKSRLCRIRFPFILFSILSSIILWGNGTLQLYISTWFSFNINFKTWCETELKLFLITWFSRWEGGGGARAWYLSLPAWCEIGLKLFLITWFSRWGGGGEGAWYLSLPTPQCGQGLILQAGGPTRYYTFKEIVSRDLLQTFFFLEPWSSSIKSCPAIFS